MKINFKKIIYVKKKLLISIKQLARILMGNALNLYIKLGTTDTLTTLNLLIHEHGISLLLFSSYFLSSNYFNQWTRLLGRKTVASNSDPTFQKFVFW